jgi:hypothetical protein
MNEECHKVESLELVRETWMWRALIVFLILLFSAITVFSDLSDRSRHASDNKERAMHWQKIEDGIEANRRMILALDDHQRLCLECHAHPGIAQGIRRQSPTLDKKVPHD